MKVLVWNENIHETNPSYRNSHMQQIIKNAVKWACPVKKNIELNCPHAEALEK